ncbi:MAG: 16S rRNA (uracil(1498)-N(3))-methyltransferase [Gammaproteobacteria bacterium]|nr:16S rRNA (uracil(1498)-N(3))-methyltransferase [Gammaproteobacteria bacterium]
MKHRLYHPPPLTSGMALALDRDRAHYLLRVLRLREGAELLCFDGAGRAWAATVADASPRRATLDLGDLVAEAPPPEPRLHLAQGQLKGAAMDRAIQKATELGVTDIWPLRAERSNVPADRQRLARKHDHWQKIIENAAEQCATLYLPRLHPLQELTEFLAQAPPAEWILLQPGAPALPLTLPRTPAGVLVGPEGGWTESELQAAAARQITCHGLGSLVLRGETAPLAALAAIRHGWGWQ